MKLLPSYQRWLFLLAILSAATFAKASEPSNPTTNSSATPPPAFSPYHHKTNVIYGETHGTGLLMDVFTTSAKPNGLAIIDVVSGAYNSDRGKINEHAMAQIYSILCSRGYTVFAIRPGSKSRYNGLDMLAHVKTGIRYVKQHAAEYKIDPDRLGLTGASAGGHLATLAAVTADKSTQVKAAAVFFPPTDFLDWDGQPANTARIGELYFTGGVNGHSEEEIKQRAEQLSPARLVKPNPIPFLLIHGDADSLVPLQQSQKMVAALKAAGGRAELIVKKGGGHPWFTIPDEVKLMADWFDKQLAESSLH